MSDKRMRVKLAKQLLALLLLVAAFVWLNSRIYNTFTYRYIDDAPEMMREQSIELDRYLPFDDASLIVKQDSEFKLKGELPVLDGATALFPVYSAFVNAIYPQDSAPFDGRNFTESSSLKKTGTRTAYNAVADGAVDVIFAAQPSLEQLEYAKGKGAELVLVPIGYEAFVFIVNANNPIESLTSEQIRGVYSGQYTNWSELGIEESPIVPVQRAKGSGSQTAMEAFMQGTPFLNRPTNLAGRAIGYSFRLYVSGLSGKQNIKMLAADGVYPTEDTIRSGAYPITDCFYAVYRADNPNGNIPLLLDWILSKEGQRIIKETGYVPIS